MDFFYKPPVERPDECQVLEENYMNCMVQKALKDNVLNNRCVLDSILWFHLECPKSLENFDNPEFFKVKFRDYFADIKEDAELIYEKLPHMERLRKEYELPTSADDVKLKKEVVEWVKENKEANPARILDDDGENDTYLDDRWDQHEMGERGYGPQRRGATITAEDSAKFGDAPVFKF